MKILPLIIFSLLLTFNLFAEEEVDEGAKEKTYTESEFREEVVKEVQKELKRLGHGKVVDFAKELMKKEDELKLKELELMKKNEQLTINMDHFEKKIVNFKETQKRILGCLDEQDAKRTRRLGHMVDAIAGMKPVNAAQVLSVQDPEITIEILGKLDAVKVSKIFNLMDKEISARLQKQYMTMKK